MNLLDKKLGLLIVVALTFFACEDEVGSLTLNPESNLGIFFVETPLTDNIGQFWAGSAPSSFAGIVQAGSYEDPSFGIVASTAYCDLSIGQATYDTLTINTATLTSLEFYMRIIGASGNFTETDEQVFDLYQLENIIDVNSSYNSGLDLPLANKIGEAKFNLYADSINLTYTGSDTPGDKYDQSRNYIYTINFELTRDFETHFISSLKSAVLNGVAKNSDDIDSVNYYLDELLKGFAIVPASSNSAIIQFNLNDGNTALRAEYDIRDGQGQSVDQQGTFILNGLKSFSNISPNENNSWVNSDFDDLAIVGTPFNTDNDFAYFQAGSNMFISIDLSDFRQMKDTLSSIIFQKAEIIIEDLESTNSKIRTPSSISFFITSLDSLANGSLSNAVENSVLSDLPVNSSFNTDTEQYQAELSLHLQAIVDNQTKFDQIILGINTPSRDLSVSRFVVKKNNIKLRYYYSIPDKN